MPSIEELNHLQIPLQDILLATNSFSNVVCIDITASGKVYKGESKKYGTIAVKRLDLDCGEQGQDDLEFRTEIRLRLIYKHENIISLLGFCDEAGEKVLVYKYERNGSLDKHIKNICLPWTQRLKICLEVACGLKYLHDEVAPRQRLLHRDIKASNILLDDNWQAKVSDFGLSRTGPAHSSFVISNTCGTLGYVDPEYLSTGRLTQESDVYSFGVVLFELLSGRLASDRIDGQFFSSWVKEHYLRQRLDKIVHSDLHEQISPPSLLTFTNVAYRCLNKKEKRPALKVLVEELQKALDNQLAASRPWSHVYSGFTAEDDDDDDFYSAFHHRQLAALPHNHSRAERGLVVIPVFYRVDPSDVRRQKRAYGVAFSKHESENIDKVEPWRKTLADAANIAGFVVNGDEERAIEQIVYSVTHTYLCLIPSGKATAETNSHANLIGIDSRVQDLRSLLESESGGVRMVGICGIWGSGKSALASSIYDEINHKFEGCCFVQNVCAESTMHGLKALQEKILSNIFKLKVILTDIEQGVAMMTRRLCRNRVLVVLDDVRHAVHLNMLAGSRDWFGDGSLIIITSRNQDLVNAHSCITHNVRMLDADEAIELFSRHAFGQNKPAEGYEEMSERIVSKFCGHPSTLKNLGSFLHDREMIEWTRTLARLEGMAVDQILKNFDSGDDGVSRDTFSWLVT